MFDLFFFFKQKTAYDMRISDLSSDVCSSDLPLVPAGGARAGDRAVPDRERVCQCGRRGARRAAARTRRPRRAARMAMGVHSTFFGPIKYAILPQHLRDDEFLGGIGLVEEGTYIAVLAGTIAAGRDCTRLNARYKCAHRM